MSQLSPESAAEGGELHRAGRVLNLDGTVEHLVNGVVNDPEGEVVVTLFCTRGRWNCTCECDFTPFCGHSAAVAIAWLERNAGARSGETSAPAARPRPFAEAQAPVIEAKLGRKLDPQELRTLAAFERVHREVVLYHGRLLVSTLRSHGFGWVLRKEAHDWEPMLEGWWNPAQPPATPLELWQYMAYDLERRGEPIPELFRPLTDTGAVSARLESKLVQESVNRWQAQLKRLVEPDPYVGGQTRGQGLDGITGVRVALQVNGIARLQTRRGDESAWKPATANFIRSLPNLRATHLRKLAPAEAALIRALAPAVMNYGGFGAKDPLPPEVLEELITTPETHAALVLPGEQPFAVEEGVMRAAVLPRNAAGNQFAIELVLPDGRIAEGAHHLAGTSPAYYLHESRVRPGPAPLPHGLLPAQALEDPVIFRLLRSLGVTLPEKVESNVRRVPMRPRLECGLEVSGLLLEHQSVLRVRLLAVAEDPPCRQEWRGRSGWQWEDAPPPRRAGGPVLDFDLSAANRIGATFGGFRLYWNDWTGGWNRPVTGNFAEEFAAWVAALPPETEVIASPELAGFFEGPLRATIDFSALPVDSGRDWFDLTIACRVEDSKLTPAEIALLLKARGKWVRLPKSGWKRLELDPAQAGGAAAATLDRLGITAADVLASGNQATHRVHALQLALEAAALEGRDARLAAELQGRLAALTAQPPPPLPAGLTATLRPYQVEGFHFLAHLAAQGFGGVLADDMGLGKTVQTLAWLLHLADGGAKKDFKVLVVCPKSVTHGWMAETGRFASALPVTAFTPALAETAGPPAGLLVANYAQLRLHAEWLKGAAWDAVVLDEGQFIKNPASQIAAAARALVTRHRLVLTGTPVENRLADLWSLFAFAQPGLLGPQAAFRRHYDERDPAALSRLHRRVRHFLLRRTKAQAAPDLPPRTEDDLVVELEPAQRRLYDAELKRARAQLLGIETDRALDRVRFNVLASLLRLRQICCHPALIDPAHAALGSAKLDGLIERLEELREEGHQVLVFSQFVGMLELIRDRLVAAGIGHLLLTGATEDRQELVAEFQRDPSRTVFLLSLKAAGFGLNLTAASYAILYDPWWNPAVEAQAIDRTHRIGQTRPVMAYRLLAADTIEQKIRALQREKAALAAAVVQEESLAQVLDLESLRRILA